MTLSQLVEFKEKHGRLLPALRTKIEAQSAQIAMLLDPEDRADATQDFVNDCRLHVEELCEAMRFSWKTLAFGTLVPLAGSGLQWASTAPESRMAFAGTALSFTAAVFAAFSSIGGLNDIQSRQPLAYIAYARKRFSPNFQIG